MRNVMPVEYVGKRSGTRQSSGHPCNRKSGDFRYVLAALVLAAFAAPGCNRAYYRRQADWDAYNLVREKANHPHWDLERYTIAVDPRSRMYDPFCADCPPIPPDDPVAHELMHCVDNKRGWPFWHDNGDTANVENPAWPAYLEFDARGALTVSSQDAVRIALLNSPNYQQNLEQLYLSALDVSFERFRFDTQGFAGYETFFTADGRLRGGGGQSSSIFEANTRNWRLQRLFSTGSELVVGFANSLVWQFSGPDDYSTNTLIDFALFQPLLRDAGRERVLERLTTAERALLGNVRIMEQYRQGFYLSIITGRGAGPGPSRSGGVIGTTQEVQTTGSTAFALTGGGAGGGGGFGGDSATPQAGGYMGLLQDQQQIRNLEDNVERQRANLYRLEEFLNELKTRSGEAGLVGNILNQDLQVAQARQALLSAENTLVSARNTYQASLDQFKNTLGLPPQICLEITDPMLDQFQLIDPATMQQQRALERIVAEFGAVRQRIVSHVTTKSVPDPADPMRITLVRVLEWYPEIEQDLADLKTKFEPITTIRQTLLDQYLPEIEQDLVRFEAALPRRKEWLAKLRQRLAAMQEDPCSLLPVPELSEDIFSATRLDESLAGAREQLARLVGKINEQYQLHLFGAGDDKGRIGKIDEILANGQTWTPERLFQELYDGVLYPKASTEASAAGQIADIFVEMPADIIALQLVQARARSEAVELVAIDIRADQALEVARKYRRDWMNNRAGLVNAWRNIEFVADQLQGTLDVFFSGDIGNANPNQPFSLNSDTGRLRVGVQFDAPITRLAERNAYRQALISYQQQRRQFYAFEDSVARNLRATLRTALTNQLNFEYQRQAVLIAAQQIDRNEDIRINGELTAQGARATAARDAVSALTDLLNAQNQFLAFWVNYEVLRRGLDFDLGTFQLDAEGLWIDPGTIGEDYGKYDPWLWRTGGADCPLPAANEVTPPEVLAGLGPTDQHAESSSAAPHGQSPHEALPPAQGLPLVPPER
ncbi:MAG: TolC family protein [Planctomycetaceae bacterium]|nr:TolC family protein [Planctomycetaceae bacterium]